MPRVFGLIVIFCTFSLLPWAPSYADDAADPFSRDVLILTDWYEGEFDNEEQLWFHRRSRAEGEPPVRIHTIHTRVDAPKFGEHVFYVEEYRDNDPKQVIRQRLVVFSSDLIENAIRVRQGFFKNPEKLRGKSDEPEKLSRITPDDVTFLDTCDVFMRRKADQFEGSIKPKACIFGEGDERRYSVHDLTISANKFWRNDATFLVSDDSFFRGTPIDQPTKLRRARIYWCDFYFYDAAGGQQVVEELRVFSQGGSATVARDSDGALFDILIREKEYPYYNSRPDFIYYSLRRTGEERSIAFGVADPDSRQFGLNNGDMAAFCHLDGYEFRESIHEL